MIIYINIIIGLLIIGFSINHIKNRQRNQTICYTLTLKNTMFIISMIMIQWTLFVIQNFENLHTSNITYLLFFLTFVCCIYTRHVINFELYIDKDTISFRNFFRTTQKITFEDVNKVVFQDNKSIVVYGNEKKLFTLNEYMINLSEFKQIIFRKEGKIKIIQNGSFVITTHKVVIMIMLPIFLLLDVVFTMTFFQPTTSFFLKGLSALLVVIISYGIVDMFKYRCTIHRQNISIKHFLRKERYIHFDDILFYKEKSAMMDIHIITTHHWYSKRGSEFSFNVAAKHAYQFISIEKRYGWKKK